MLASHSDQLVTLAACSSNHNLADLSNHIDMAAIFTDCYYFSASQMNRIRKHSEKLEVKQHNPLAKVSI